MNQERETDTQTHVRQERKRRETGERETDVRGKRTIRRASALL